MGLRLFPVNLDQANDFVTRHHRHNKRVPGCKLVVGAVAGPSRDLRGVAIVGRPVSRVIQEAEPQTCEIVRVCTDGAFNACSLLYGACRRAAFAVGYTRVITYTLPDEGGASLRAAGFRRLEDDDGNPILFGGGSWDRKTRRRIDAAPTEQKWLWEARRGSRPPTLLTGRE